jgi:hypothetical protein
VCSADPVLGHARLAVPPPAATTAAPDPVHSQIMAPLLRLPSSSIVNVFTPALVFPGPVAIPVSRGWRGQ